MQRLEWEPYFRIAERNVSEREKLQAYACLARRRLDADRFEEFCARHLRGLDELVWEFFGSSLARDTIRKKVEALYPEHEVEEFTELFWEAIQLWRNTEGLVAAA